MAAGLHFAVVGATGAVGREMISTLQQRGIEVASLRLLASERSAGEEIEFHGKSYTVEILKAESFRGIDIALFSAGGAVSREFGPIAAQEGAVVIDNSSCFRMDPAVPLIVPEVNAAELRQALRKNSKRGIIIANPNCSTAQLVVVLKPLHDAAELARVVVSTYQSVSGAGKKGMDELWNQTLSIFNQKEIEKKHFPKQIAFNCIPHIDVFLESGYTKEEQKIIDESRKILSLPDLRITSTAVRVPVFSCHAESVNVETKKKLSVQEAKDILRQAPGVMVVDDPTAAAYPVNVELYGTDASYVGRIREDFSCDKGLNLWVVADNLRKGAALNAVQIAEVVIGERAIQ